MTKSRVHVYISGIVQGVHFRQNTKNQAQDRGLTGWVRNLDDGRVEAVFEGEKAAVQALVEYCHYGPKDAIVSKVLVDWEPITEKYTTFSIIHSPT